MDRAMDVASPVPYSRTFAKERSMAGAKHLHVIVSEVNVISAAMRKVHRRNQVHLVLHDLCSVMSHNI